MGIKITNAEIPINSLLVGEHLLTAFDEEKLFEDLAAVLEKHGILIASMTYATGGKEVGEELSVQFIRLCRVQRPEVNPKINHDYAQASVDLFQDWLLDTGIVTLAEED